MKRFIMFIISIMLISTNYYQLFDCKVTNNTNYIEINKLRLEEEIKSYKESSVDKNIIYLKESNFDNNFYILAAHSGNSKIAYFKNLYKLHDGDIIKLSINNKRLTFKVSDTYYVRKTGKIKLEKNMKDTLVLTTCDRFNNSRQLVVKCTILT